MCKISLRLLPILIFLALSVFLWRGLFLDPHKLPSVQLGRALPNMSLPQLDTLNPPFNLQSIKGRVVLLNVWASWCEACVEEQVFLMQLARDGVPIYGLNYKDKKQDAQSWLKQWGNPYQLIVQDKQGKAAIDLGVYGAPETFIIDKQGLIRYRHVGILTAKEWQKTLAPLMKLLEAKA